MQRQLHREFSCLHNTIGRRVPVGKAIHAVLDNYLTHKHPRVLAWPDALIFHFTPTSASLFNAVENFLSKMTRPHVHRSVFCSITDLQTVINAYFGEQNACRKPFL